MMMPTKERALALYDSGQHGPAIRVAGGKNYLDQWLSERASTRPPVRLPNDNIERLQGGRPKGRKTKKLLAERLASRHSDLPLPDGGALIYHVEYSDRTVEEMKRLGRAIRTAALAVCTEFDVSERQVIFADSQVTYRDQVSNARAAFVSILLRLAPDITDAEVGKTLGIDRKDVPDIKRLFKAVISVNDGYRKRARYASNIAREQFGDDGLA